VLPLVFQKQRGWPLTKRIRKGAWKQRKNHCSNCYATDHNVALCKNAIALHGRRQRAWDRESTATSLDSDSDLSTLNTDDLEF
jgi:hypothetical protein